MNLKLLVALLFGLLVSACAGSHELVTHTGPRYGVQQADMEEYRLSAGDKVRLTVYNEAAFSGEFAVSTNGQLSLPLIGDISAENRTVTEITADIQHKLADGYLRDPKVNVEITAYRPFFILGEVSAPGQYPYASGMTVLNAVATAQGFSPRARRSVAYIRKAKSPTEEAFELTPDLRVQPGDTIRIGERYF